jgi:hypothetical protein
MIEINVKSSPVQKPVDSPDTMATDTVIASSPEPNQEEDFDAMDMDTLQECQYTAIVDLQQLTVQLARAQSRVWHIAKRIKTMREHQRGLEPSPENTEDMVMERID